jgi:hypothetical protein
MFERIDRILLISGLSAENCKTLTMNVTHEILVNSREEYFSSYKLEYFQPGAIIRFRL